MANVFISYSRNDIEFAKRLTGELQKSDLDYWIDWEGIPPTVDWWNEIEKGIEEADAFVFLISPDSANSKVCQQEIEHAVKNGKHLIPLVIRETNGGEIPNQLNALNWIFFRAEDDFDASVKKLLTSIHTDYDWVQAHRRLQVKALEWERNHKENSFLLRGKDLGDAELQLATNSSKEPYPTDIQREYVFESRKATDRQRRNTISISIAGVIITTALAIFGFIQAKLATDRANVALARQLASQAQSVNTTFSSKQMVSTLLYIQSMKLFPNADAANFLINNNKAAISTRHMTHYPDTTSVAFSPDGKYVVSGGSDKTARVWEVETGKEVARMTHDDRVTSVAFSPDGRYIVSGSWTSDGTTRVWEAETGKELTRMNHNRAVISVAFSPNGKYVISDYGASAVVWEVDTGEKISRMAHDAGSINSVAFNPDGEYVVSGGGRIKLRVYGK